MSIYLAFGPQVPLEQGMFDPLLNSSSFIYSIASNVLEETKPILGYDPVERVREATERDLRSTVLIQPMNFVYGEICRRAFMEKLQGKPVAGAFGQSLGEYNAMLAARMQGFETMLYLAMERGRIMGKHFYNGTSDRDIHGIAIVTGLPEYGQEGLGDLCDLAGVHISNINRSTMGISREETRDNCMTIAGLKENIARAVDLAVRSGANKDRTSVLLDYNVAYHAPVYEMQMVVEDFSKALAEIDFNEPSMSVFSNVDAAKHTAGEAKDRLLKHLINPVLLNCHEGRRPHFLLDGKILMMLSKGILPHIMDEAGDGEVTIYCLGRGTEPFRRYFAGCGNVVMANSPKTLEELVLPG